MVFPEGVVPDKFHCTSRTADRIGVGVQPRPAEEPSEDGLVTSHKNDDFLLDDDFEFSKIFRKTDISGMSLVTFFLCLALGGRATTAHLWVSCIAISVLTGC